MTFKKYNAGRKAYRRGKSLEDKIEKAIDIYQLPQNNFKYEVIRNYDAMQKSKRGAFTVGKSSCDYSFWSKDFCGMIEAKARGGKSIRKDAVAEHQRAQLKRLKAIGHHGFVCVQLECDLPNSPIYLVDIDLWDTGDKKSHNKEDLAKIGIKCITFQLNVPDIMTTLHHYLIA